MYFSPIAGPAISVATSWTIDVHNEPGSAIAEHAFNESRVDRTYVVRAKLFSKSALAGPLQAIAASGIRIGQTYAYPILSPTEGDTGSFVLSIRAEGPAVVDGKGYQYDLTITCGPTNVAYLYGSSDLDNSIINPTDMRPLVFFDSAKYKRSKPEDEGDPPLPYINTVGDPLINTPETEETRPVLKYIRNEPQYNDAYASQFKDTVNADVFLGYPPNTVKCRDIRGERFFDPDWGWYFKVTYEFEFRDDDDGNGYSQFILNAGYRQLKNGTGSPVNVTDASGNQVTDAVPLQEDGSYQPTADPFFLQFTEFPSIAFELLNIDESVFYQQ